MISFYLSNIAVKKKIAETGTKKLNLCEDGVYY